MHVIGPLGTGTSTLSRALHVEYISVFDYNLQFCFVIFDRRLADGNAHCADSTYYVLGYRSRSRTLTLNPNPITDPNPNPNPKINKKQNDTGMKLNIELYL